MDSVLLPIVTAIGVIIAASVSGVFGAAWLNRRNLAKLTAAQAENTNAGTTEITDRIARAWIKELEQKVELLSGNLARVSRELEHEIRVRRGAIAFIERLLDWIAERHPHQDRTLPLIPDDLSEYITDPYLGRGTLRNN